MFYYVYNNRLRKKVRLSCIKNIIIEISYIHDLYSYLLKYRIEIISIKSDKSFLISNFDFWQSDDNKNIKLHEYQIFQVPFRSSFHFHLSNS